MTTTAALPVADLVDTARYPLSSPGSAEWTRAEMERIGLQHEHQTVVVLVEGVRVSKYALARTNARFTFHNYLRAHHATRSSLMP